MPVSRFGIYTNSPSQRQAEPGEYLEFRDLSMDNLQLSATEYFSKGSLLN